MPNLLDQLNKGLNATPAPQQKQAEQILKAKKGKATVASGPSGSSLAENQVLAQAGAAQEQLRVQGVDAASAIDAQADQVETQKRLATQELDNKEQNFNRNLANQTTDTRESVESREEQVLSSLSAAEMRKTNEINNLADNQLKTLASQRQLALDDIFSSFEQSKKELEFRKDAAELEQLGFLMAMNDAAYVDELQAVAKERNLMDDQAYREEMLTVTLGDNFKNFLDEMGFREFYNEQGRINESELAKIDINSALQMAAAAARDANNQAIVGGVMGVGKAGADYYAQRDTKAPVQTKSVGDASPTGPQMEINT